MPSLDQAARELGLSLVPVDIRSADELETAFVGMKRSKAEASLCTVRPSPLSPASRLPI